MAKYDSASELFSTEGVIEAAQALDSAMPPRRCNASRFGTTMAMQNIRTVARCAALKVRCRFSAIALRKLRCAGKREQQHPQPQPQPHDGPLVTRGTTLLAFRSLGAAANSCQRAPVAKRAICWPAGTGFCKKVFHLPEAFCVDWLLPAHF